MKDQDKRKEVEAAREQAYQNARDAGVNVQEFGGFYGGASPEQMEADAAKFDELSKSIGIDNPAFQQLKENAAQQEIDMIENEIKAINTITEKKKQERPRLETVQPVLAAATTSSVGPATRKPGVTQAPVSPSAPTPQTQTPPTSSVEDKMTPVEKTATTEKKKQETQNPPAPSVTEMEQEQLATAQAAEQSALGTYNQAMYANQGQILNDIESEINKKKAIDETAQKRENAFRYISGLGDTLSSLANLVGVANGAASQQQTYNSNAVVQKAEEARKARKIELEDLSTRLDEMKARQREMQASGSLEEAKLKNQHNRELLSLQSQQRKAAEEQKRYDDNLARTAMREARQDFVADRAFNAQQEQIKQTQENWEKNYNMQYKKFMDEQNAKNYNFTLANESFDIPKDKLNEVNVERIFQMLPDEIKKNIKGEQYTEIVPNEDPMFEPTRKTSYKAPSLAQKLAAIGAYADSNEAIRNELKRLVPPKGKSGRDWSDREVR